MEQDDRTEITWDVEDGHDYRRPVLIVTVTIDGDLLGDGYGMHQDTLAEAWEWARDDYADRVVAAVAEAFPGCELDVLVTRATGATRPSEVIDGEGRYREADTVRLRHILEQAWREMLRAMPDRFCKW